MITSLGCVRCAALGGEIVLVIETRLHGPVGLPATGGRMIVVAVHWYLCDGGALASILRAARSSSSPSGAGRRASRRVNNAAAVVSSPRGETAHHSPARAHRRHGQVNQIADRLSK
jgi:hypothetical protein